MDNRFSNIRPRRPKGGPDGGRDIEALTEDGILVWGAVGFRANVTDSSDDKGWVRAKFRDDLDAAKAENPSLSGFLFFTNVGLTPAEVTSLKEYAHGKGVFFVDIYWRERLRITLDNPVEDFVPLAMSPLEPWPDNLTASESTVPWVDLALKMKNPPANIPQELARTGWSLDSSRYTPERIRPE